MATINTKFVINAYGQSAGGVAPHFRLLVDGKDVGQATVSATTPTAYTFNADIEAGKAHKVQVVYDNDGSAWGQDRNLNIKSIVVNGNTMLPTQASYDRFELDGKDIVAGQEGMWWDGALIFSTPATYYPAPVTPPPTTPTAGTSTIVVNAQANVAGGVGAHFNLLIDGVKVGEGMTTATAKDYTFTANVSADQAHKVQVQYDNDTNGRDLMVNKITINGKSVLPTASNVTYDRGALDGRDVIAGQSGMWWDGTLVVNADKSYFPGSNNGGGTNPPAPTPGTSTIVVNAQGNAAGGVNAHFNLLIDGKKVGEGTVGTSAKDYTFNTSITADQAHKVQIQYDNDAFINGQDRNLIVNKVTINGKDVAPTASNVTYDKGALDGKDVIAGQEGMWWDGTLVINADKSYFPGSNNGGGTNPPAPNPTTPSLSVNDVTVREPGMTAGSTGAINGFLHTEGNQIVDSSGNYVKLTGVNWFGSSGIGWSPNGLWAREWHSMMDQMKSLGFNSIRLDWSDAMLEPGRLPNNINYGLNPDLQGLSPLQIFDKVIDYAGKLGMKVILDHHRNEDGAGSNTHGLWYTDMYPESKVIANWKMLAQRYAGNTTVIGADLHNEPNGPATWGDGNMATDWKAAAERIGNAIQTVNTDWLMFVEGVERYQGTWDWWGGNLRGSKTQDVEFNTPNKLVYSVHSYGPSVANWNWFSDPNYPNNLHQLYTDSWGHELISNQHPIWVGEFGGHMTSTTEKQYMQELVQYMEGDWNNDGVRDLAAGKQGASWAYWSWNPNSHDTGGILKDDWTTVDYNKFNLIKDALFTGGAAGTSPPAPPSPPVPVIETNFLNAAAALGIADPGVASGLSAYAAGRAMTIRTAAPTGSTALTGDANTALLLDGRALPAGAAVQVDGVGYLSLVGAVQVTGGAGSAAITGDAGIQVISAGDGDDTVSAGGGGDLVNGNTGADVINGNMGDDTLFGGRDDDVLFGGRDNDLINGNLGADVANGNLGRDTVRGGQGNDTLFGGQDSDELWGDLGEDSLSGDLGDDTLFGGAGADIFVFRAGAGMDVIADFNAAEGDRIELQGLGYAIGAAPDGEALLSFSDGSRLQLAGIGAGSVTPDWILSR